ncbi:peptide deformylase [uncultured Alistipes sp.]|uniref:peptide deformylase n=1 Tax=uncultured Alistipes sp. TaxID=538949 RepID=UPI00266D878A|nr:peptide deformylase [uncultured Alistipes sp.]
MKFPTLPIRLWTALAAALVSAGCARPAFEVSWRQTLDNADGGLLRVWSIADRSDSLFLRRRAEPVTARTYAAEEFGRLCEGLLTTVRNPQNEGVGIAAPQVGIGLRVIAVQRFDLPGEPFGVYVNPEIVRRTGPAVPGPEGCLSVPDRYGDVARPQQIEIRYRDSRFIRRREVIRGYTAVIFQHEVDHLDGILFIDRMAAERL